MPSNLNDSEFRVEGTEFESMSGSKKDGLEVSSSNDESCRNEEAALPTNVAFPEAESPPATAEPDTGDRLAASLEEQPPSCSSNDDQTSSTLSQETSQKPVGKRVQKNRCSMCRKKVGLIGYKCRCGNTYCSRHRYTDKHACTFDFKALGAREIEKNNPLVVAQKVTKI